MIIRLVFDVMIRAHNHIWLDTSLTWTHRVQTCRMIMGFLYQIPLSTLIEWDNPDWK